MNKDVCVQCNNSDPSSDCRRNPSAVPIIVCTVRRDHGNELVHNSSGCYLKKIGVYYERGCLLDLPSDEQTKCQSESPECQSCFVPFCNVKVDLKVRCYECNSKTNALCEREQNAENAMKFCNDYSKTCGIGIDEFGVTHRGCFPYEDLSTNSSRFPIHSMKCSNNLCNKMAERRIKCHQCEGVGCDSPIGNMTVCKAAQDQCYSYKTEGELPFLKVFGSLCLISNDFSRWYILSWLPIGQQWWTSAVQWKPRQV